MVVAIVSAGFLTFFPGSVASAQPSGLPSGDPPFPIRVEFESLRCLRETPSREEETGASRSSATNTEQHPSSLLARLFRLNRFYLCVWIFIYFPPKSPQHACVFKGKRTKWIGSWGWFRARCQNSLIVKLCCVVGTVLYRGYVPAEDLLRLP